MLFFGLRVSTHASELVSAPGWNQAPSATAAGDSCAPVMSADGRYVLFASTARNLVSLSNTLPWGSPSRFNVYLRDRAAGTITLISSNLTGAGANGDSLPLAISTNGQYALFLSDANDLVANDTNNATDVFLRDTTNRTTILVSCNTNGLVGNGKSHSATMTPDGHYVAFVSAATDLVQEDTNGIPDVFVRDVLGGVTTLASVGATVTNYLALCASLDPELTPDGRYVAFFSTATNLVPGANAGGQVFVRDLLAGTTLWASSNSLALARNTVAFNHKISSDGQFVAYEVAQVGSTTGAIRRFNLQTGQIDTLGTNAVVSMLDFYENFRSVDMTPDGRFVAFIGKTNYFPTGPANVVYLWDAQTGRATLASGDPQGQASPLSTCDWPSITPDGRFVLFLSSSLGLTTNSLVGSYHVYLRDVQAGATSLADADTNGIGSQVTATTMPQLSADARFIAFEAADGNLVPGDRNRDYDVFVTDTTFGTNELISVRHPMLPNTAPNDTSVLATQPVSGNGRYTAFASAADNLVANDTNGFVDIFVRDLLAETNLLVSVATNGVSDGASSEPVISADGRYVAFSSFADDLVPADTNGSQDVFLRDSQAGTTLLVSLSTNGIAPGSGPSYSPTLSASGRYVLFRSQAINLAPGSFGAAENIFLRDMQAATTISLTTQGVVASSMTPSGAQVAFTDIPGASNGLIYIWNSLSNTTETNSVAPGISCISISPNGNRVACWGASAPKQLQVVDRAAGSNWSVAFGVFPAMHPGLRFTGDGNLMTYVLLTNNLFQVYFYDFVTQAATLVSHNYAFTGGANGSSDWPEISPDGRFIAYRSAASDVLSGTSNSVTQLFLYDRWSATNVLLSSTLFGNFPAGNRSGAPVFTADGRMLIFESWAPDLVAQDFNECSDVFSFPFLYVTLSANGPGPGQWLSWPFNPAFNYRVEFKNGLNDVDWQSLGATVTKLGTRAFLNDMTTNGNQRFYRVVAY